MHKPRIFIGSSAEHLDLAYAAQECLEHDADATVWTQGVFDLSRTAMASLIDQLDESDFGLFVLSPDDVTSIRGSERNTVRDNVIFELGLFIGRLGTERAFLLMPRGADDLHLPSDLLGLTPATFDAERADRNMVAALGPGCNRIRKAIAKLGLVDMQASKEPAAPLPLSEQPENVEDELCDDPNDCITIIESWMGSRGDSDNKRGLRFADIDRDLRLAPGSARKYIAKAASRWGYVPARIGKDTILFVDTPSPF